VQSRTPPEQYIPFLREKRIEMIAVMFGSVFAAAALVNGLAYFQGDFGSDVIVSTLTSAFWVIVGTLALTALT